MSRGRSKNTSPTCISPSDPCGPPFILLSHLLHLMVLHLYVSGMVTSSPCLRHDHALWGTHHPLSSGPHSLRVARVMKTWLAHLLVPQSPMGST